MAILKVANVFHDTSGYTRTQTSAANTISWVTSNEVKATLNVTGVLHVHQGINTSNLLVNGVPATDAANSYAYSTGVAAGAGANTVGSAAFAKANAALANGNVTLQGTLTVTGGFAVNGLTAYGLANVRYLTSGTAASYTPTPGTRAMFVECVGGGAGGGSANGTSSSAGVAAGAYGGGAGAYSVVFITDMNQTFKYTIGAGGAGGSAAGDGENNGNDGGTTSFYGGPSGLTDLATAPGGTGGFFLKATSASFWIIGAGGEGGVPGVGDLSVHGGRGGGASRGSPAGVYISSGAGGNSVFGQGGDSRYSSTSPALSGNAGLSYGSGGSGACVNEATGNGAGGAGTDGIIRVWEYA